MELVQCRGEVKGVAGTIPDVVRWPLAAPWHDAGRKPSQALPGGKRGRELLPGGHHRRRCRRRDDESRGNQPHGGECQDNDHGQEQRGGPGLQPALNRESERACAPCFLHVVAGPQVLKFSRKFLTLGPAHIFAIVVAGPATPCLMWCRWAWSSTATALLHSMNH